MTLAAQAANTPLRKEKAMRVLSGSYILCENCRAPDLNCEPARGGRTKGTSDIAFGANGRI